MMELYCYNGKPHQWTLSGKLFTEWVSTSTSEIDKPNKPNRAEQVCCNCQATRIIDIEEKP